MSEKRKRKSESEVMFVTASHVVTGVTRSDRRRRLGQSVVQSVTILQLFGAAVCVMNRLDCDVDMGEQAELSSKQKDPRLSVYGLRHQHEVIAKMCPSVCML